MLEVRYLMKLIAITSMFMFRVLCKRASHYALALLFASFSNQVLASAVININTGSWAGTQFAYVANGNASATVSMYRIDQATGVLNEVTTPVAAGIWPHSVTVEPNGKFVYVANYGSNTISVYRVDPNNGVLIQVDTALVTGTQPASISIDPQGKFAYVANATSNNLSTYSIDQATGALKQVGTPVAAGKQPNIVAIHPSGKFAYVANIFSNDVFMYSINPTTGALNQTGAPVATGAWPYSIAVEPAGKFAYVANYNSNTVSVFRIDPASGSLTLSREVASGLHPYSVAVDPSGRFVYVTNVGSGTVSVYTIDQLNETLIPGVEVPTGADPTSITIDASGRFVYVANYSSNNISTYTINPVTGALIAGPLVTAGPNPYAVTTAIRRMSPIVFIPGMMGSKLLNGQNIVWPDKDQIQNNFTGLKLPSPLTVMNGKSQGVASIITGNVIGNSIAYPIILEAYEGWLAVLRSKYGPEGERWIAIPYDWRQEINSKAASVQDTVNAINALYNKTGKKVLIVTHSMGSLIAKTAVRANPSLADKIEAIVFVAAPQLGTPETIGTLLHGNSDLTKLNGITNSNLRLVVNDMPGVYALVPSEAYFKIGSAVPILSFQELPKFNTNNQVPAFQNSLSTNAINNYRKLVNTYFDNRSRKSQITTYSDYLKFLTNSDNQRYFPSPSVKENNNDYEISLPAILDQYLINNISNLHGAFGKAALDDPSTWNKKGLKVYQIIGHSKANTICGFEYSLNSINWGLHQVILNCDGDETVVLDSANATKTSAENFYVDLSPSTCNENTSFDGIFLGAFDQTHIKHRSIMAAKSVQDEIFSLAQGIPLLNINSDCPITNNYVPPADPRYTRITIRSPVYFSVSDSAGHMTGNYPDGKIKEEIPGSHFYSLGESKSITLPSIQPYRLEMIGFQNGLAGFNIALLDDKAQYLEESNYDQIPVVFGMRISANFVTAKDIYILPVDFNGDGVVDQTIHPVDCVPISACVVGVPIEINPLKKERAIEIGHDEEVKVALLSTIHLDASLNVDRASLTFGRFGYEKSLVQEKEKNEPSCEEKDVNRDGLLDLICEFKADRTGLTQGDTVAILQGRKLDGSEFEGRSSVLIASNEDEQARHHKNSIRH